MIILFALAPFPAPAAIVAGSADVRSRQRATHVDWETSIHRPTQTFAPSADRSTKKWFLTQKGLSVGATRECSKHPMWNEDPVMTPFRDVILTARAPGWPGPSGRKAAEVVSKYIITDMYTKAVQGMPAEDAVKWAHAELVKIYGA